MKAAEPTKIRRPRAGSCPLFEAEEHHPSIIQRFPVGGAQGNVPALPRHIPGPSGRGERAVAQPRADAMVMALGDFMAPVGWFSIAKEEA